MLPALALLHVMFLLLGFHKQMSGHVIKVQSLLASLSVDPKEAGSIQAAYNMLWR